MKQILAIAAAALLSAGSALAQSPAAPAAPAAAAKPAASATPPAVPAQGNTVAASAAAASPAASICATKAVDKNGRKLHGAAKASFMKKCEVNTMK